MAIKIRSNLLSYSNFTKILLVFLIYLPLLVQAVDEGGSKTKFIFFILFASLHFSLLLSSKTIHFLSIFMFPISVIFTAYYITTGLSEVQYMLLVVIYDTDYHEALEFLSAPKIFQITMGAFIIFSIFIISLVKEIIKKEKTASADIKKFQYLL
ncbi:MAG: hypothetical protein JEY94_09335 [Melioribacteraceae bacterium]|nr:hypothetical protein [Melioribacteraceae bacterium]